jgi:excisionase family DNA binding protein
MPRKSLQDDLAAFQAGPFADPRLAPLIADHDVAPGSGERSGPGTFEDPSGDERPLAVPPSATGTSGTQSRPARRYSPRWWAERLDYPRSTIYKAIQQGHLRALRPRGGSYIIPPRDFADWFEGDRLRSNRPPTPPPGRPGSPPPPEPEATRFRHVRWPQLPDGTPDGACCS